MVTTTPFHPGELAIQDRVGVREQLEPFARQVIRPFLPDQQRAFYGTLPFMVAAARDRAGRPWATLLAGRPGFVSSPDAQTLTLRPRLIPHDALTGSLGPGAELGLLGIEFATRRRNRINGRISRWNDGELRVAVTQSFGNCPQYIHPRQWQPAPDAHQPQVRHHDRLTPQLGHWIERADTCFIASGYRGDGETGSGMDASHRGGEAGFVQVVDERTLAWPDYPGNNYFNTLGNLLLDPRVGLLFVDFEQGHLLQLTGRATIDWQPAPASPITHTPRRVTVQIEAAIELRNALPIRWQAVGEAIRSLEIVEKRRESTDVMSLILQASDGGRLPGFIPGQHLPIEVALPGQDRRLSRTYSLSAAPNGQWYRLTVKREPQGLVSRFLHDGLTVGDRLDAGAPTGDFTLRPGTRPVVLIGAGTGVTPLMSMLTALASPQEARQVWFVQGARDGDHHPFATEVRRIAACRQRIHPCILYSRPRPRDIQGRDFDQVGRIDGRLIETLLPGLEADFYLCGPTAFVARLRDELSRRGVADALIHDETFGPG